MNKVPKVTAKFINDMYHSIAALEGYKELVTAAENAGLPNVTLPVQIPNRDGQIVAYDAVIPVKDFVRIMNKVIVEQQNKIAAAGVILPEVLRISSSGDLVEVAVEVTTGRMDAANSSPDDDDDDDDDDAYNEDDVFDRRTKNRKLPRKVNPFPSIKDVVG